MRPYADLLRSPREGTAAVLSRGSLLAALAGVAVASAASAAAAARFAGEVRVQDVVFGPDRAPVVDVLIGGLGVELTAAVVYLLERAFPWLLLATAFTPLFIWLLGASAIHGAARMLGARAPFRAMLVLAGHATAVARLPAEAAALLLGAGGGGAAPRIAQLIGIASFAWLALVAWHGVCRHYAVAGDRAVTVLGIALTLFYVVPGLVIAASLVAVLIAALVLGYV